MKKNKMMEKFSIAIIGLILYICYFNAVKAIYPGYVILLIITFLLLCIYIILNKRKKLKIPIYYMIIPLIIAISEIYTINSFTTTRYLIIYILLLSIAILITQIDNWKNILIKTTLMFSIIAMVVTIMSFLNNLWYLDFILPLIDEGSRETMRKLVIYAKSYPGLFASTGLNAFFISLGLAIVFVNLINDKKKKKRDIALLILFGIALFLTLKRATLVINLLIMVGMLIFRNKKIVKNVAITIVLLLIALTIMTMFFPNIYNNLMSRFSVDSTEELLNGRGDLYKFALESIKKEPLKGFGFGCFSRAYSNEKNYKGIALDTHNEFLQLLSELGIIQGGIFMIIILKVYYDCFICFKNIIKIKSNEYKKNIWIAFYIQSYFLMYCMSGNPLHDTTIFFIVMLYGLICEDKKYEIQEQVTKNYYGNFNIEKV